MLAMSQPIRLPGNKSGSIITRKLNLLFNSPWFWLKAFGGRCKYELISGFCITIVGVLQGNQSFTLPFSPSFIDKPDYLKSAALVHVFPSAFQAQIGLGEVE